MTEGFALAGGWLLYGLGLAYLGWVFGSNWDTLQEWLHQYNLVFYAALAALVAAAIAWKWRDLRKSRVSKP